MDRLLALAAAVNLWLKRGSIHGMPADKLLHATLWTTVLLALLVTVRQPSAGSWAVLLGTGVLLLVLSWAATRHNVIFRATEDAARPFGQSDNDAERRHLFASGRFLLWEGDRSRFDRIMDRLMSGRRGDYWLLQVPVVMEVTRTPAEVFSFVSWFDASERFFGIPLENKAGMWTIVGTFDTLEAPIHGELLLGWRSTDAILLRFCNEKGRRRMAVLTSDSAEWLHSFHSRLAEAITLRDFDKFRRLPDDVIGRQF